MKTFIMKKTDILRTLAGVTLIGLSSLAQATPFTSTSSTSKGLVPGTVSSVGGVVFDLVGLNGTRVISQLAASSLFVGFYNSGTPAAYNGNPGTIGIQTGWNAGITSALGGGIAEAGIRFSLYDGDSASGNFDFSDNTLEVNGSSFGNWSSIPTQNTDSLGNAGASGFSTGFRNNLLDTGWFYSNNSTLLNDIYNSLVSTEQLALKIHDVDPFDNFYDFTQGIDNSLINVGSGPVVTPGGNVPEPTAFTLLGLGLAGMSLVRRRKA
ncbi:MAG: PEP-CTERM sorting domain-containing protein [Methylobacter sp.]|nr:PEP-CTERM sorting domain-containing protein [Methylobacter sp.]